MDDDQLETIFTNLCDGMGISQALKEAGVEFDALDEYRNTDVVQNLIQLSSIIVSESVMHGVFTAAISGNVDAAKFWMANNVPTSGQPVALPMDPVDDSVDAKLNRTIVS